MFISKSIPAEHKDLIHDVAYDFHGRRMATCSSDQCVKVWDLVDGEWKCTASWKTHSGSVWRVTWAHPEFGQVIATCSFDRTALIWEELPSESGSGSQWIMRSRQVDSRTSVTDIKFAPKHLGLQLATCSADGSVRVYEAPDVMNLCQWTMLHEFSAKLPCSSLSWSPSRVHPPMIAVGCDDANPANGGKVHVFEYSDNARKWSRVETISTVTGAVRDVTFAPNLGRQSHMLAVASKHVTIVTLTPLTVAPSKESSSAVATAGGGSKFTVRLVGQFDEHNSQVWRLSWNVTGTILASSGDDGCVRLWKANYLQNWKCLAVMRGDGTGTPPPAPSMSSTLLSESRSLLERNGGNTPKASVDNISSGGGQSGFGGMFGAAPASSNATFGAGTGAGGSARYMQLGSVQSASQVPWH